MKRTIKLSLAKVRHEMLHQMGISCDYYQSTETNDNHCRWICTDSDCEGCGSAFNTYPKFINHLRIHHNFTFSEIKRELIMRQNYHYMAFIKTYDI